MASVKMDVRYRSCINAFGKLCVDFEQACLGDSNATLLPALQHQLGRLQIWAGDVGATKTGRAALEYQLQDSEDLYDAIVDLVDDLYSQLLKR